MGERGVAAMGTCLHREKCPPGLLLSRITVPPETVPSRRESDNAFIDWGGIRVYSNAGRMTSVEQRQRSRPLGRW